MSWRVPMKIVFPSCKNAVLNCLPQEKKLTAQQKAADRKARTRRLIAIGAGVESVLQRQVHEGDELNSFLDLLRIYDIGKEF